MTTRSIFTDKLNVRNAFPKLLASFVGDAARPKINTASPFFNDALKDGSPKTNGDDGRESAPIAPTQPCYPGNSAEELCCFCETLRMCVSVSARVCMCVCVSVH